MNQSVFTPASRPSITMIRIALVLVVVAALVFAGFKFFTPGQSSGSSSTSASAQVPEQTVIRIDSTDSMMNALYDEKIAHIANGDTSGRWPVKTDYPMRGSILPYKRIVSYYGNLYSKQMGILGELPPTQMLAKLQKEVENWQKADSALEVIPALHYIAVTAQQYPGKGNKYRLRMPFHQIDSVLKMAARINAIVFIDVQVGLSTLQEEIPELEKYLKMPNVHLGIDPEFSMKGGQAPGKVIGSFDAADINYTTQYLAKLVKENNIPPKILVIHRFTKNMVTNYKSIKIRPETQIVMDMDGWGGPTLKYSTYKQWIYREPVQYTGFKLFYKNDIKNSQRLLTPKEVLALKPQPVYIQYQ
jgi:hypothetical protein